MDEFAEYGIAGARVDRIGAAAGVNKAQIYSYFGNKDQLFNLVLEMHVASMLDEVAFTANDLPDHGGLGAHEKGHDSDTEDRDDESQVGRMTMTRLIRSPAACPRRAGSAAPT